MVVSSVKSLTGEVILNPVQVCQEEVGTSQRQYRQVFIDQNEEKEKGRSFDSQQFSLRRGLEVKGTSGSLSVFCTGSWEFNTLGWEDSCFHMRGWSSGWSTEREGWAEPPGKQTGPSWGFTVCISTADTQTFQLKEEKRNGALASVTLNAAASPPPEHPLPQSIPSLSLFAFRHLAENSAPTWLR